MMYEINIYFSSFINTDLKNTDLKIKRCTLYTVQFVFSFSSKNFMRFLL